MNIRLKRFYHAEEAPIRQGQLRQDVGYNSATLTDVLILDRSYIYPEEFDQATKELCIECALIRKIIPENSVKIKMTKDNFILHWKKAKEETSSSYSGLHFGHYKVGTASAYISHFHALKATLIMHHGIVLERWAQGLSVMLQKLYGCSLITKLCSILLMEADFNGAKMLVFGSLMLEKVRRNGHEQTRWPMMAPLQKYLPMTSYGRQDVRLAWHQSTPIIVTIASPTPLLPLYSKRSEFHYQPQSQC